MGQKYLFPKASHPFCLAKQYLNPSPDPTYSLYDQQSNPTPCLRLRPHKLQRLRALNAQNIYSRSRLPRSASQGACAGGFGWEFRTPRKAQGTLILGVVVTGNASRYPCREPSAFQVLRAKGVSVRCKAKKCFGSCSYGFSSSEFGARDGEAFGREC